LEDRVNRRGNLCTPTAMTRSASLRTGVKEVLTLLVNAQPSISNAIGVRVTRGMASVSLAFECRIQARFSERF
jgi:hypothetical protein